MIGAIQVLRKYNLGHFGPFFLFRKQNRLHGDLVLA